MYFGHGVDLTPTHTAHYRCCSLFADFPFNRLTAGDDFDSAEESLCFGIWAGL